MEDDFLVLNIREYIKMEKEVMTLLLINLRNLQTVEISRNIM